MSMRAKVGIQGSWSVDVQAWISNAAWLPSQHSVAARSATRWSFGARSSRSRKPVSRQIVSQRGGGRRDVLLPEARCGGAVREALEVERPVREVREHDGRDAREVVDEVPLGHGRLVDPVPGREEDLVEVGEPEVLARDPPWSVGAHRGQGGELRLRDDPGRVQAPAPGGAGAAACGALRPASAVAPASRSAVAGSIAFSRTTSRGSRPASRPLNEPCRTFPSRDQPPSAARITSSGRTQRTPARSPPQRPLVVRRRRRVERGRIGLQRLQRLTEPPPRPRVEAGADLAGEPQPLAFVHPDHERPELRRGPLPGRPAADHQLLLRAAP